MLVFLLQPVVFAYAESTTWTYHGPQRFSGVIDFSTGASKMNTSVAKVFVIHGIAMFVAWGVLAPFGLFTIRFLRHKSYWLEMHKSFMSAATYISLLSAAASLASTDASQSQAHHVFGLALVIIILMQLVLGFIIKFFHIKLFPPVRFAMMRYAHKLIGYLVFIVGIVTMFLGVDQLNDDMWGWMLLIYIVFVVLVLLAYDVYFNMQTRRHKNRRSAPPMLVTFTASQVDRQIRSGAKWVILSGRLYDVAPILASHPGGSYLLERCIGVDITAFFGGKTTVDGMVKPHLHTFRAEAKLNALCVGTLVDGGEDSTSSGDERPTRRPVHQSSPRLQKSTSSIPDSAQPPNPTQPVLQHSRTSNSACAPPPPPPPPPPSPSSLPLVHLINVCVCVTVPSFRVAFHNVILVYSRRRQQ